MKVTRLCPKCDSQDVIEVKGKSMQTSGQIALTPWSMVKATLDRYICVSCGYTEEYVQMSKSFRKWADKELAKSNDRHNDFV